MHLERKDLIGLGLLGGTFVIVIFFLIWMFGFTKEKETDIKTACLLNNKIGHTVFLVDVTDPFEPRKVDILQNLLTQFKENIEHLGTNEKLSMYLLQDENPTKPTPIFSGCRPLSADECGGITCGKEFQRQEFDRLYSKKLDKVNVIIQEVNKSSNETNLLEMIRAISLTGDFKNDYPKRRLIILSDMLHHNKKFSLYNKKNVSYEKEKQANPKYFNDLIKPQFGSGLEVALYILQRENQPTAAHWYDVRSFWLDYFTDNGIKLDEKIKCDEFRYFDKCIYVQN